MAKSGLDYVVPTAKAAAQKHGADAVVMLVFKGDQFAIGSYGKDKVTCRAFADVTDEIHALIASGAIEEPTPG